MWIKREVYKAMQERIANLEDQRAFKKVTVRGWRGPYGTSTDDFVEADIGEALRLLAEHCGMEFSRTPRIDSQLTLKKRVK